MTSAQMIKKIRIEKDLSQIEVAEAAGMRQTELSSLESGKIPIGVARAKKLAKGLGVHPSIILFPELYEKEKRK